MAHANREEPPSEPAKPGAARYAPPIRQEVVDLGDYEILTLAVIIVLAAATTAAIYLGLLGMAGQGYVVRCTACGHLTFSSVDKPQQSCPRCRHPLLLDPLRALGHSRFRADTPHATKPTLRGPG